jgi:hypothetical protein
MSRKYVVPIALALMSALGSSAFALSECTNQITLVPLTDWKAANRAREFDRFRYPLSPSDSLLIRSHEDAETIMGPYDTGFVVTRDGKTMQTVLLRELAELKGQDPMFSEGFTTLSVTSACGSEGPIYFVSMQWEGDMTSPALFFTLVPSAKGYEVSHLPMISGGVLEVSRANPFHLRTWDNLAEGSCNACETAYQITEYEIRDGKPIKTRQYRTRHLYTSGDHRFDDRRRIRFIP